jgi:alcohol dehydrogenase, propanol-preferring
MRAMVLEEAKTPLQFKDIPIPSPGIGQLLIRVLACGVCRTDLHIADGELPNPSYPIVLGHQIVGEVSSLGKEVSTFKIGDRIGVPWLQGCCGHCKFCLSKRENLCSEAVYTGFHVNGGFAEYCVANAAFCYPIPTRYSNPQAAPLLCAGLIGYRALRIVGEGMRIGFYGFGASAHILIQVLGYQGRKVFAFTRTNDSKSAQLAAQLGAVWVGSSEQLPPEPLDAAIIFAPVGELVPAALKAVDKGGRVVCAGIHMSDIPSFPYSILWEERSIHSVTNLTRQDGREFLALAAEISIQTHITTYRLEEANQALEDLRGGKFAGAGVIRPLA